MEIRLLDEFPPYVDAKKKLQTKYAYLKKVMDGMGEKIIQVVDERGYERQNIAGFVNRYRKQTQVDIRSKIRDANHSVYIYKSDKLKEGMREMFKINIIDKFPEQVLTKTKYQELIDSLAGLGNKTLEMRLDNEKSLNTVRQYVYKAGKKTYKQYKTGFDPKLCILYVKEINHAITTLAKQK